MSPTQPTRGFGDGERHELPQCGPGRGDDPAENEFDAFTH